MTAHAARVEHAHTGWLRWIAVCTCGWRRAGMGRDGAARLAREHAGGAA